MQLLLNSRAYSVQDAVLLLGLSNLLILSVYPSSQSAFRGKMDMLSQLGIAFNPKLEISKQQWTRLVTELSGDVIRKSLPVCARGCFAPRCRCRGVHDATPVRNLSVR